MQTRNREKYNSPVSELEERTCRFGKLVAEETEKWARVMRAANMKAE